MLSCWGLLAICRARRCFKDGPPVTLAARDIKTRSTRPSNEYKSAAVDLCVGDQLTKLTESTSLALRV
jgi:hypothetical protein